MIYVINTLRANLIHKEIEGKLHGIVGRTASVRLWDLPTLVKTPNLFRVDVLMRRLERVRRQRWAPWRNER